MAGLMACQSLLTGVSSRSAPRETVGPPLPLYGGRLPTVLRLHAFLGEEGAIRAVDQDRLAGLRRAVPSRRAGSRSRRYRAASGHCPYMLEETELLQLTRKSDHNDLVRTFVDAGLFPAD
jgi:hypothetical protein